MSKFNIYNFPNEFFHEVYALEELKNNNFIQTIISSFHDYDNLYFVSKFYEGCITENLDHIWNEKEIKFFSACLIQSFIGLREVHLIHRDVHYWNLMLDEKKYIVLIDFHIAINHNDKDDPNKYRIGSPKFCAPEMIRGLEYDYNSDYFRLGIMLYYNIMGKNATNSENIIINNKNINLSSSCIDFINKLIVSDKNKRIGFNSIYELKNHDFFKNFNWNKLINRKMKSPFKMKNKKKEHFFSTLYNFTKKKFISSELLKNKTFREILYSYDKVNDKIIKEIIFRPMKNASI